MTTLKIVETPFLERSRSGMLAANLAMIKLVENGWNRHCMPGWDRAAILVEDDAGRVVAGVVYLPGEKDAEFEVAFAWCSPDHPRALAMMASKVRAKARDLGCVDISFGCHPANEPMRRLVDLLKATPYITYYRVRL